MEAIRKHKKALTTTGAWRDLVSLVSTDMTYGFSIGLFDVYSVPQAC